MFNFNYVTVTYIVLIILPIIQFLMFLASRFKITEIESDYKNLHDISSRHVQKTNHDIECLNLRLTALEDAFKDNKQQKPKK